MATPPLPPRPLDAYNNRQGSLPPPIPPLPSDFRPEFDFHDRFNQGPYPTPNAPHFAEPLLAPKPTKLMNDVPADMARRLDDQVTFTSPPPPQPQHPSMNLNPNPGFRAPGARSPYRPPQVHPSASPGQIFPSGYSSSPLFQPQPGVWRNPQTQNTVYASPPASQTAFPSTNSQATPDPTHHRAASAGITQSMANLTFGGPPPPSDASRPAYHGRTSSYQHAQTLPPEPRRTSPKSNASDPPSLTATFPTISSLIASQPNPASDPARQVAWARDVFWLVEHSQNQQGGGGSPHSGPVKVNDPQLYSFVDAAISMIQRLIPPLPLPQPTPNYLAEAVYMRGRLASNGSFPDFVPLNPREAFRYFEASAKAGFAPGWFQLGRDYEGVNDFNRAKSCFEKGVKAGVESCSYRMGMAHLLGQLGLNVDFQTAIPLLQSAASNASMEFPQPAYVWGLLLLNEFPAASVPLPVLSSFLPPGSSPAHEAKRSIERAAYMGYSPAQYKMGHAYEYAISPFPFDPLLSVQYYSLASQQGEDEADMALSKWFLCGSEGAFEKDENLAYTFAEKAARKGLPTAMFAMGYYAEVGVGRRIDLEVAKKWYNRAAEQGNTDAVDRLKALSQPSPQMLSRAEHEDITDSKLVRRRTQARNDAIAEGRRQGNTDGRNAEEVVGNIRKHSLLHKPRPEREGTDASTPPVPHPQQAGRGAGGGGGGRFGRGGRASSPQAHPPAADHRRPSVPNTGSPSPGPGPRRQQPATQQSPAQNYASLHDPGPVRPTTHNGRPSAGSGSGPTTFAEMGFHSTKLEDKDCVIM